MKKKHEIWVTLGPSSLNKDFLKFCKNKVSLLRLNMSHINLKKLPKIITFVKKNSNIPICIDTEGAQIRTKVKKNKFYKKNSKIIIGPTDHNFNLYPNNVISKIKVGAVLDIGFDGLIIKVIKKKELKLKCKVLSSGKLKNNKGVYCKNKKIVLKCLTEKDFQSIKIANTLDIKNFALSFTNSVSDMGMFNELLPKKNKIYKIETLKAVKNIKNIMKLGDNFLIDRGDLSKDVKIENIPIFQNYIIKEALKLKKNIFVATNFLESMLTNNFPTRGEVNDIFNTLEKGATGLVLAAETAIGKNPKNSVNYLKKVINSYLKYKKNYQF